MQEGLTHRSESDRLSPAMARPPGIMVPLSELLKTALKKLNPSQATAVTRIQQAWPEIAGPLLAPHIQVWKLVKEDLKLKADGASWAQEFHFHRQRIMKKLEERFPDIAIRDLKLIP